MRRMSRRDEIRDEIRGHIKRLQELRLMPGEHFNVHAPRVTILIEAIAETMADREEALERYVQAELDKWGLSE